MPSRKVSNETFYPFIPYRSADAPGMQAMRAVKDLFVVVQGDPDATPGGTEDPRVDLVQVTNSLGVTRYAFSAYLDGVRWDFGFDVPENTGLLEVSTDHATMRAVMIIDSDDVESLTYSTTPLEVEPARVLWYDEQVSSLTFANIQRIDGVEDASTEIDLLVLGGDPIQVSLEAGHNTEWSVDDDGTAVVTVAEGIGLGRNEDYGDTAPGGTGPVAVDNVVRVVNGMRPINGDVPIFLSGSLGLETVRGRVTIVKRSP